MKILVVDDEKEIRELIEATLKQKNYDIETASNGVKAMEVFDDSFHLVLLDVMMPFKDGIITCQEIREKSNVPIVFLTAKVQDADQILGLSVGADDYIKKPFVPSVLLAKVQAVLRRSTVFNERNKTEDKEVNNIVYIKDIRMDKSSHQVFRGNKEIILTKTEFDILLLLATYKGQVFSIEKIYEHVWKESFMDGSSNTVMVHIKKLRDKVELKKGCLEYIKTVWGVGYKVEKD